MCVLGIYSTFKGKALEKGSNALQQPYIRIISMTEEEGDSHSRFNFTQVRFNVTSTSHFTLHTGTLQLHTGVSMRL